MTARYVLFQGIEAVHLKEKAEKLLGVARILDNLLQSDFDAILAARGIGPSHPREVQIKALNEILAPPSDIVAGAFPGVGAGYFSLALDACLTYGPREQFGHMVGASIDPFHIGRQAMARRQELVGVGPMVRGEIMACIRPLIRKDEVIGYTFASEALEDIYRQIQKGAQEVFFSENIEPVTGLTGLLLVGGKVFAQLEREQKHHSFPQTLNFFYHFLILFLNSLNIGVLVVDDRGKIIFYNQGLKKIFGLEFGSVNISFPAFLAATGLQKVLNAPRQTGTGNGNNCCFNNLSVSRFDGRVLVVNAIMSAIKNGSGDVLGHVFLFEDVGRVKEEEARIARAAKLATLGELAAFIAHEIKNPLTILSGSVELLPARLEDQRFLKTFTEIAAGELERINATIEALLDFARFSEPNFKEESLNQILRYVIKVFSPQAEKAGIVIEENLQPDLPPVEIDARHVEQAFFNLFLNAFKAMPQGGKLSVTTSYRPGNNFVQVCVADTGCGIKPEEQSKIFDPFFTTSEGGTGIGLALVHHIMDEHRGIIEVDTELGKGSRFYLHFLRKINAFTNQP
ncbi:MAG: ATP-binding protein [Bacillota bacterium]